MGEKRSDAERQARYLELLGEYKNRVANGVGLPGSDPLEAELDAVECDMLDNPPLCEVRDADGNPTGEFRPRAKGLLPPTMSGFPSPRCRTFDKRKGGDFIVIPTSEWSEYVGCVDCVDMRTCVPDGMILDQDGVGSCASESMTGCIMASRVKAGQESVKLNPWFAYHTVSGGHDGGSTLSDNVAFALEHGVCSQAVYGRDEGWRPEPSQEAYEDAKKYRLLEAWEIISWEEFGTACILGFPVYFGYSGHAIWASKVLDTSRLEYCNSWGDWGDAGFGTLNKSRIVFGYGLYAFRAVTESEG